MPVVAAIRIRPCSGRGEEWGKAAPRSNSIMPKEKKGEPGLLSDIAT